MHKVKDSYKFSIAQILLCISVSMAGVKPSLASQATAASVSSVKKSAVAGTGVKSANKAPANKKSQQQQIELVEEDISKSVIGMQHIY